MKVTKIVDLTHKINYSEKLCSRIIDLPYNFGRISSYKDIIGKVFSHNRTGPYYHIITNGHSRTNNSMAPDPDIISYINWFGEFPSAIPGFRLQGWVAV